MRREQTHLIKHLRPYFNFDWLDNFCYHAIGSDELALGDLWSLPMPICCPRKTPFSSPTTAKRCSARLQLWKHLRRGGWCRERNVVYERWSFLDFRHLRARCLMVSHGSMAVFDWGLSWVSNLLRPFAQRTWSSRLTGGERCGMEVSVQIMQRKALSETTVDWKGTRKQAGSKMNSCWVHKFGCTGPVFFHSYFLIPVGLFCMTESMKFYRSWWWARFGWKLLQRPGPLVNWAVYFLCICREDPECRIEDLPPEMQSEFQRRAEQAELGRALRFWIFVTSDLGPGPWCKSWRVSSTKKDILSGALLRHWMDFLKFTLNSFVSSWPDRSSKQVAQLPLWCNAALKLDCWWMKQLIAG